MNTVPSGTLRVRSAIEPLWLDDFFRVCCLALVVGWLSVPPVSAQTTEESHQTTIRFSFQSTPWRDVIDWLAEEARLALHVSELPTGSFTYSDESEFTVDEAIDRVNLFLLPQGFTLVRSGKLLSVINLRDPSGIKQLSAMATLVTPDQLDTSTNEHDVVKCIFPLGELDPDDAVEELNALHLMMTPAVFEKTKRLMIVDTVAKLRSVQSILDAFIPDTLDNGTVVKSFFLQNVEAEDVLLVARPHLGLATGEMIGIDVSISADLKGKHIFVTGVEDKVKLIENLVKEIDQPTSSKAELHGGNILQTHPVQGGNVKQVYDVLQTLLAGKEIRLSMDESAETIVALADAETQTEIVQTISQMRVAESQFEIIPLRYADPYFVISLLNELLTEPVSSGSSKSRDHDEQTAPSNEAKIDADPNGRRLFVQGKPHEIEQIKTIVEGIDVRDGIGDSDDIRVLPLRGKRATDLLILAAKFWRENNPIVLYDTEEPKLDVVEKVINGNGVDSREKDYSDKNRHDAERSGESKGGAQETNISNPGIGLTLTSRAPKDRRQRDVTWLSGNDNSDGPAIWCMISDGGLIVQSSDVSALDEFENHLRVIGGPLESNASPPMVFYLKYTKANDAIRLLAELLDGHDIALEADSASLVNGYVSSFSDSFLGSIVSSADGTTAMVTGNVTVVADPRLNRLIVQGSSAEIEQIENYLEIIDKDESLTDVFTHGEARVIELTQTRASEVAEAIRQAFPGRISASAIADSRNQAGDGKADARAAAETDSRGEDAKKNSEKRKNSDRLMTTRDPDLEPKMTIAVHEPSNSLIVTGPDDLFKQVQRLASSIDQRNEKVIEVVTPINGAVMEVMLRQALLGESPSGSASQRISASKYGSSRSGAPTNSDNGSAAYSRQKYGK